MRVNWRTVCGSIKYFWGEFRFVLKSNKPNILRFNPIQIAEWLDPLCRRKTGVSKDEVEASSDDLGVVKSRVIQFLNLLRFPAELRVRLKKNPNVAEGQLRPFTRMNPAAMRAAVGRLLGMGTAAKAG